MDVGFKKNFMSLDQNFLDNFKDSISSNIKLSNYSWFNLGGPAEYLFKPKNKDEIIATVKKLTNKTLYLEFRKKNINLNIKKLKYKKDAVKFSVMIHT